jgi:phage tail protein X
MSNDFTFTLSLETQQFAKAAQDAAQAVQKMSQDAVDSIQKITNRTTDLTERLDSVNHGLNSMGQGVAGLSGGGMERHIGGASDAMDRLGGSSQKAASGLDRAAKAGAALEGLKAAVEPLGDLIDEMGPKTTAAVEGITSVLATAGAGFAAAGPIGAAVGGGVAALKGLWDWAHAAGEEQLRTIELASEAQDMLNRKIQEHVHLLQESHRAAVDRAQEIIHGSNWEQDGPRRAADERAAAARIRDLQMERERIEASYLPKEDRVEAERALDKRALRNRLNDAEAPMVSDLEFARAKQERLEKQRDMFAEALENTPAAADIQRKGLSTKIEALDAQLAALADSIQKTTWKLNQQRDHRASLAVQEDKTIDARRDREADALRKDDEEKDKAHLAGLGKAPEPPPPPKSEAAPPPKDDKGNKDDGGGDGGGGGGKRSVTIPNPHRRIQGVRFANGFQYRNGKKVMGAAGGGDDEDEDGEGPAGDPRQIRGVRSSQGFQYRNGKKIMGAAGGDVIPTPDPAGHLGRQGLVPGGGGKKAAKDPVAEETLNLLRSMNDKLDQLVRASK